MESWPQRFGFVPPSVHQLSPGAIWIHAISVGEILAAAVLVKRLREQMPAARILVTAGTIAGRAVAEEKLKGLADGVFYAPMDMVFAVRAVLRRIQPALVIVLETEIWPNLWRESRRFGASLMVVNGRISDKAMPRYRRMRWFFRTVLDQPNAIMAQSRVAYDRFRELGAGEGRLSLAGNLKYDFEPASAPLIVLELVARAQPSHVWIAASTMPPSYPGDCDEDDAVLIAFDKLRERYPRLLLILAPRKPERFDAVAAKLAARNIFHLRRSQLGQHSKLPLPGVLLVDTIGELASLFRLADAVFMGGTLADRGGHNLLEPAYFAKPVITGPHLENFPEMAEDFRREQALCEIPNPEALPDGVRCLLENAEMRHSLGEKAHRLSRQGAGATQKAVETAADLIDLALPRKVLRPPAKALLTPLSWLWRAGAAWKRWRLLSNPHKLPVPVISVGGISMGGAGKTPCALYLARQLEAAGWRPGFLTRGYRRRTPTKYTLVPRGGAAAVEITGDEAQIIVRSGLGPVGIGAQRYETGLEMHKQFQSNVFILDDAFQHWRLARDVNLVLLDALQPFGELFPAGRLREPLSALRRASAVIITRSEPGREYRGIVQRVRAHNSDAPIFYSRLVPRSWVDFQTAQEYPVESMIGRQSMAFCGLGNPASFWTSLRAMGCKPCLSIRFPDHHRYRPREINRVASQAKAAKAEVALTTEKDAINLPPATWELLSPIRVYWLRIGVEMDEQDRFLDWLNGKLAEAG